MPNRREKKRRAAPGQDLDFEIAFFEGVVKRDPHYIEALQILGDAYTKNGQYDKGLRIDEQLAKLCPADALVFYNLACSLTLTRRSDDAIEALEKAVDLGYHDLEWLKKDHDLEMLRRDARFKRIVEKLSHGR